jgi:hypothetical protein
MSTYRLSTLPDYQNGSTTASNLTSKLTFFSSLLTMTNYQPCNEIATNGKATLPALQQSCLKKIGPSKANPVPPVN